MCSTQKRHTQRGVNALFGIPGGYEDVAFGKRVDHQGAL